MELVGTEVKKTFPGFGTFTGKILCYDASAGYFKIQYEDGDSEEVDHDEIASILDSMGVPSPLKPDRPRRTGRGRPPKKRRRMDPDRTDAAGEFRGGGPEIGPARGENSETLPNENGDSRVLEEVQVKMEELEPEKSTPDLPPRRRSARKAKGSATLLSHFGSSKTEDVSVSEDADLGGTGCFSVRKELVMPALPPSSTDLDLDGLNVFDFFSVYTCLRSFSRLLFLSPFTLEAFVAALRCKYTNLLVDSIHYSILQTLKPHLEFLSEEGSETAVNCLRSLNWGILDLVTWPLFLAEYLLIHASRMKLSFKISRLNLLDTEYYEHPAGVKLEILRCLCDDVVEVETLRLEINRRMADYEANADANCNMNVQKKSKPSANVDPCGPLAHEVLEETDDGNSDECCLCGMEGSLICCDGCPAAFHSRCVGVVKDLLPEGDWYCPECVVEKSDKLVKLSKPFRGAEMLGIDPHGRVYFGTCDRLLVSGSCDSDASYHYYNKNDLSFVINILKSSYASYSAIINAISMYWGIHSVGQYGNNNHVLRDDLDAKVLLSPSKQDIDDNIEKEAIGNTSSPKQFGAKKSNISNSALLNSTTSFQFGGLNCPFACSEPFDEMVHAAACLPVSQLTGIDSMNSDAPSEIISSSRQAVGLGSLIELTGLSCTSPLSDSSSYQNYYSLGRIASSIAKELLHKLSENNNNEIGNHSQDIRSAQLKAISQKSNNCWYSYDKLSVDAQKESCGWCICCKTSSDHDCLFKVSYDKCLVGLIDKALAGGKIRMIELHSVNNKNNHIDFAIYHMLLIEDRVRGLLSGPWENPHYSDNWQEAVSKASDAASLKPLLLSLESSLRRIALSVDWLKPSDYSSAIGSGSILMSTPARTSSNSVASRKQAKKLFYGDDFSLIPHATTKSSNIYWWRGGKFSRQVFQWKMLPRSLASKGARQGGCRKIPNIIYSDSSEFAKRIKRVAWQAAVEMSQSVIQIIYQVQELDANIKWMELSETRLFYQSTSKKVSRSLKKVTIRRKRIEGTLVKYLLDFGKKETVPAIVTRHGVLLEEHSSGRKSYWLNETLVPLNLLKSFEERKIARSLKKSDSGTHSENGSKCEIKKKERPKGFSYLMSRVQKFDTEVCGHCNKDVLVREAVTCQICTGFFHRKHFRVPKGAIVTTYTCCKCKDKNIKEKPHGLKGVLKRRKIMKGKTSQAIPKNGEHMLVKNNKFVHDIPEKGKLVLVKSNKKSKVVKSNKKGKLVESKKRISGRKRDIRGKFITENTEKLEEGNPKQGSLENSGSNLIWRKKGKRGKSRKKKSGNLEKWNLKDGSLINYVSDFSWCKRKRSVMHYCYWRNGLLWTHKPFNEHHMHFRERKILLPWQHSQDPSPEPVCCLCREEFKSGVIYIGCQNCGDWFHGDAFSLTLENIKNVVGFKCHSCRMRSKPICPFSNYGMFVELESRCNGGVDILGTEHQNDEEKLHCCSYKKLSPIVDSEYHLEENQGENILTHSVKELPLGANHQIDELDIAAYEDGSIDGHILGANPQHEKLDNGRFKDGSAVANHLSDKQREDVLVHPEVVPNLYSRTMSTTGPIVQSLKHVEANVTSTKLDNKIQVGIASQEMEDDLCRMREVPDSLPARKLDSLQGAKT